MGIAHSEFILFEQGIESQKATLFHKGFKVTL